MKLIPALRAAELMSEGAVVVDIREPHEYTQEHIPGALHRPLSALADAAPVAEAGNIVVFHCRMGNRTMINADKLAALACGDAYILEGGLDAWKAAGLPIERGG